MEKENLGWDLKSSDHYWLMRADLAIVKSSGNGTSLDRMSVFFSCFVWYLFATSAVAKTRTRDAMARAVCEYRFVRRSSHDPEVHGPLLEGLLSLQTTRHIHRAADALSELLQWSGALQHSRIRMILWHIVLGSGTVLSDKSKRALLNSTTKRLRRQTDNMTDAETTDNADTSIPKPLQVSGIFGLADLLSTAIFSRFRPTEHKSNSVEYRWAVAQAMAVFGFDTPFAWRWNSLVLLGLYKTAPADYTTHPGAIIQGKRHYAQAAYTDWDVICALATIERSFDHNGPPGQSDEQLKQSVQSVGQSLIAKWCESPVERPKFVARVVSTSFLRLAAIANDASLTAAVYRHSIACDVWSNDNRDTWESEVVSLATELIWASFNCGADPLKDVVADVFDCIQGPHRESVIAQIFTNMALRDHQLAKEVYSLARDITNLPTDATHSLAMSLASQGFVHAILPFFRDPGMSQSQISRLLSAVLLNIARQQNSVLHPDVAAVLSDVMHVSYAALPPAPKYHAVIQNILPVLASSRHAAKAGAIFETILNTSSSFFSGVFIQRFLHVLIRHAQYVPVTRITKSLVKTHPRMRPLRKTVVMGLTRGGAVASAIRANKVTWGWRNHDAVVRMAQRIKFRLEGSPMVLTLKISSRIDQIALDAEAAQFAMHILVLAGRFLSARRLFFRTRGLLNTEARTMLGNDILSGYCNQLGTQDGRHMRKVLAGYDCLVLHGEFIPDRVTINIMFKAILRWLPTVDTPKLRLLFDLMVKCGYPGGADRRYGQFPFDTPISALEAFQIPKLDTPILFLSHVRPMLKMFIKAFHTRDDMEAAQRVIGILKLQEMKVIKDRNIRRRIKSAGRVWVSGKSMGR
jgi:hypothetical protein